VRETGEGARETGCLTWDILMGWVERPMLMELLSNEASRQKAMHPSFHSFLKSEF
jgi:RNAse (barnase) inhibitor barstar